ncbi:MAG: allantoinase AllB, partial [Eubacteriales bacterium]
DGVSNADVAVKDGKIAEIAKKISAEKTASKEIDAKGLHVLPGLIDAHVHFNEPGSRTEWEGLTTGSSSLAAGGITTFFDMPLNSDPELTNAEEFKKKKEVADQKSIVDYGILGGLVPENFADLKGLKDCGVVAFKGFMCHSGIDAFHYFDDKTLMEGMEKIAEIDGILMLHAESPEITTKLAADCVKEGRVTVRDFVASRPVISEIMAVEKAVALAEVTGCKVHIVHASSGEVVECVTRAKKRGVNISVETCGSYLALNIEDFEEIGPLCKCCPPVREQKHVESLWKAIENGEIDTIGSDHSPAPASLKEMGPGKNIFNTWGGISSAQSTLNVMLEEGYYKRNISLETITKVTSANPAKRFGLYPKKGTIAVGSDADFAIVDLNSSFTLKKDDLYYQHKHSPFVGKNFRGKVLYTILRGNTVFENNKVNTKAKGKMVIIGG